MPTVLNRLVAHLGDCVISIGRGFVEATTFFSLGDIQLEHFLVGTLVDNERSDKEMLKLGFAQERSLVTLTKPLPSLEAKLPTWRTKLFRTVGELPVLLRSSQGNVGGASVKLICVHKTGSPLLAFQRVTQRYGRRTDQKRESTRTYGSFSSAQIGVIYQH